MKGLIRKSWNTIFQLVPSSALRSIAAETIFAPCYHIVSDHSPLHVRQLYTFRNRKSFEADLDYLLKNFSPLSLADLHNLTSERRPPPKKSFFLSFDDGFREMSEVVAPICRAKGVPATFFLTTSFLDNRNLGFRHKASLLAERCTEIGTARSKEKLAGRVNSGSVDDYSQFFKSIRFGDRGLLDEAAVLLDVDFADYLRTQRPYLSSEQVESLLKQGFTIGGHSIDHPLYAELPLVEQLSQTRSCMADLRARFSPSISAFAFPFVSDGVSEEFYAAMIAENVADLFFCIGAMPRAHAHVAIQRFGVESAQHQSLEQVLREQVSRHIRRRILSGKGEA
jgi:peptidoglycan/xylan/chitin deacetylase (PgdA/CDA1 family)